MANGQHGGYRKPANPAPVSGPGALSKRTDGGPAQVRSAAPDQGYGEAKAQMDAQRVAPMAGAAPMPEAAAMSGGGGAGGQMALPGLFDPTSRPNEPITAGANLGPGPGPSLVPFAQGPAQPTGALTSLLQRLSATDTSGVLTQLLSRAQATGI